MIVPTDRLRGSDLIAKHLQSGVPSPYDPSYINQYILNSAREVLSKSTESVIVEIGAKSGVLGKHLFDLYPGISYTGIDIAPPVNYRCFNIIYSSIEDFMLSDYGRRLIQKANIIICADVLEHLADPWSLLKELHTLLPDGASIISSIPNFFHHSNFSSLGALRFNYEAWGVMDFTHLRHFSLHDVLDMFRLAGFQPDLKSIRYAVDPDGESLLRKYQQSGPYRYTEGLLTLDVSTLDSAISLAAYQYILTCNSTDMSQI